MRRFAWLAILLSCLGIFLAGCQEDVTYEPPPRPPYFPGTLQIVMLVWSDTLRFLPGDSASAEGYVVVRDDQGNVWPGVHVTLSLTRQDSDRIEYANASRDTTTADGRVEFTFQANRNSAAHYNTIHAQLGSREDNYTLWIQPVSYALFDSLRAWVEPDTTYSHGGAYADSVKVHVWLGTRDGQPPPPEIVILPHIAARQGMLGFWSQRDDSGVWTKIWYPLSSPGRYFVVGSAGALHDTAWVTVIQ